MKYVKPALTYEQQADLLIDRGLLANRAMLIERLKAVNYYRLSGYLFPYRMEKDTYLPDTTLDLVWRHYTFDRQLRLLVMDPIERIEVAVRTALAYELAASTGAFGYTSPSNLPNLKADEFAYFISKLYKQTTQSAERFVMHFTSEYGDQHAYLPIWMAVEIMPFGMTLTLLRGVDKSVQQRVAERWGIAHDVLFSWMHCLNTIRNICAHHGQLWNRKLGIRPKIPRMRKHPEWHVPVHIENGRVFGVLSICKFGLDRVAPQSKWQFRLLTMLDQYPEISIRSMGFPVNWRQSAIWSNT